MSWLGSRRSQSNTVTESGKRILKRTFSGYTPALLGDLAKHTRVLQATAVYQDGTNREQTFSSWYMSGLAMKQTAAGLWS